MLDPNDPNSWSSLERRIERLEDDMADVKSILKSVEKQLSGIEIILAKIEGRIAGLEGRMTGLDYRIASLPTTWTMLTIIFATWGIGSGILIFALNVLRK